MMTDPQLTGYFANFMVEVSREHTADEGLPEEKSSSGVEA
jgi:ubiquinone biosynthesis protein